jgi:hypothetical protein
MSSSDLLPPLPPRVALRCGHHGTDLLAGSVCWACVEERARLMSKPPTAPADAAPLHRLGEIYRALRGVASQIQFGAEKPGRATGDWRKLTVEQLLDKALRHTLARARGELLDEDGRPHLVAAATDLLLAIELEGANAR